MSSIKQTIPSFVQGMTDQPDILKIPGQVRSVSNALPDVTSGLLKRPGLKHLAELDEADIEGTWFNIFAENTKGYEEEYLCNITQEGVVRVWAAGDVKNDLGNVVVEAGAPIPIVEPDGPTPLSADDNSFVKSVIVNPQSAGYESGPINYFKHSRKAQLQELNIGATTLVCNRDANPTMSGNEVTQELNPYEAFFELKKIDYARSYTIDVLAPNNGSSEAAEITSASALRVDPGSFKTNANRCEHQGIEIFENQGSGPGTGLAFRLTAQCYISPSDSKDSPGDSNYTITVDLLNGGSGWNVGDSQEVEMNGYRYRVFIEAIGRRQVQNLISSVSYNTPLTGDTIISANTILDQLRDKLNGINHKGGRMFTRIDRIGNGLYLRSDHEFSIDTPEPDLFNIINTNNERDKDNKVISRYSRVNNVGDLPLECKNGYIVKVVNTFNDSDDYYLKFYGNDDADGTGVWEECPKPGILTNFNVDTMPYVIRRVLDDEGAINFEVGAVDWLPRTVGDDKTNPVPSFVALDGANPTINNMLLYRNRLVFLSTNNVILSQSGDLGNWFGETALTVKASDPIDINASVDTSTALYAGLVVNNGMVMFSKFNQFLFTTDSDTLSPETAKSSLIGSYDYNPNSKPFNMASNIGFFSTAGNDSIFWEMGDIFREGPVAVEERSKPVQRSLPPNLDIITSSREMGLVLATSKGSEEIWGFRYFSQGDKELQAAWFKWTMPGKVVHHWNNTRGLYWVAIEDEAGEVHMCELDLKDKLRSQSLEGVPYEYYVYLDNWVEATVGDYDSSNKRTPITIPYSPDKPLYAYTLDQGPNRGDSAEVIKEGNNLYLRGDWTSEGAIAVGYKFEMEVQLPHFYITAKDGSGFRSDTTASLTLHRLKVDYSTLGIITFELSRYGKDSYTMTTEATVMDGYDADRVAAYPDKQITIPVYDRAVNTLLTMKSDHPTPATLLKLTFEGDITENYYKNV